MPPKVKVTREEILNAAVDIVRTSGAQAINARTIATALNCSTQPIFSNFASMEELRYAVVEKADRLCQAYIQREVESGKFPPYKASGMAYIRFAEEERALFKLLYMRDRTNETISDSSQLGEQMEAMVQSNTGLDRENAKLFQLEMWAYVHGIATMAATGFVKLDWELASRMLTDVYQGLRKRYGME
jgi:AcrR family transcriptional regulator